MYSLEYNFLYFFIFILFNSFMDLRLLTVQKRLELKFYLCYFLLKIAALKLMKSRQISGVHFFLCFIAITVVVRDRCSISLITM